MVTGQSLCTAMLERVKAMTSKTTTRVVHRSSVDGQFVKQSYVKTHPNMTETERVRVPAPKPAPTKKGR